MKIYKSYCALSKKAQGLVTSLSIKPSSESRSIPLYDIDIFKQYRHIESFDNINGISIYTKNKN